MNEWTKYATEKPKEEGYYLTCIYLEAERQGFFISDEVYKCVVQKFTPYVYKEFYNVDGYLKVTKRVLEPSFESPCTHWRDLPGKPVNDQKVKDDV